MSAAEINTLLAVADSGIQPPGLYTVPVVQFRRFGPQSLVAAGDRINSLPALVLLQLPRALLQTLGLLLPIPRLQLVPSAAGQSRRRFFSLIALACYRAVLKAGSGRENRKPNRVLSIQRSGPVGGARPRSIHPVPEQPPGQAE